MNWELVRNDVDYPTDNQIYCSRCFRVGLFHSRVGGYTEPPVVLEEKIMVCHKKIGVALSVLLEASLAPCVAGAVTNAYYRAELETNGGVTRLAGLMKVQPQLEPRPRAPDEGLVPLGARLPFVPPADHRHAARGRHVLRARQAAGRRTLDDG